MTIHKTTALALAALFLGGCSAKRATTTDAGAPPGRHFYSPQGLAATATHVLVANTASYIEGGKVRFDQGFVTFIDRETRQVVGRVETSWPNTQVVKVCKDRAFALSSGTYEVDQGLLEPNAPGGIDVLNLSAGVPAKVTAKITLGLSKKDRRIGNYGSMVISPDCTVAYVGSGTRADVFSVDLTAQQVRRGPDDPVALFATRAGHNGMTIVRPWSGKGLAVVDFNSEQLCLSTDWSGQLAKRSCGSLKVHKDLLGGPIDVVPSPAGPALVLMSMANALYTFDVSAAPWKAKAKLATTGLANNRVVVHAGSAYVVNSLSSNLQRVELSSGTSTLPLTVFPSQSNPYDMVVTQQAGQAVAWVTLSKAHRLALVSLPSGKILEVLQNPTGAADGGADAGPAPDSGADAGQDQAAADQAAEASPGDQGPPADGGAKVVGIHAVIKVTYGAGGGFNKAKLPAVIQGGPRGEGQSGSSTDVLSLGGKGEIVVGFGPYDVVDGPGPDLIVFENPFLTSPYSSYAEPGDVALSAAGTAAKDFVTFPCDPKKQGDPVKKLWPFPGCAGVRPVLANVKTNSVPPADAAKAGGDAYDLAALKIKQARYLRIRDSGVSQMGTDTRGFDLDAVVLINYKKVR